MIDFAARSQGVQPVVRHPEGVQPSWDTELFVLQAENREQMCQEINALLAFLEREPRVGLKDLAATLAAELRPASSRLTIIAGALADLQTRLRRAADRLADPRTRFIKDSVGIYWFSEPLYRQGSVALLFPGEGAQYLNMLADLVPHFPEVQATFAEADAQSFPITPTFLLPANATAAEKAETERQLRSLEFSISSVLLANTALFRILESLELPFSAIAGHSAGELSALWASGSLDSTQLRIDQVIATMASLETPDGQSAQGPEALLLAVGAGKPVLMPIVQELGVASDVFLAMDNCPHQCVMVGRHEPMLRVESALQARGAMCERLPFHRPYHTPFFEPFMAPLRRMFDDVAFQTPRLPTYCCTTGQRFPDDPEAIRALTLAHWVSPVEFSQLVHNLYADGARIFVETGPRGNLTAFVEDILRGQPMAAVAANVTRRSGLTQLQHMIGQLLAHQVPLRLTTLFERRHPMTVAWRGQGGLSNGRSAVLAQYMTVMDEFLQLQQTMMEQFLARRSSRPTSPVVVPAPAEIQWDPMVESASLTPGSSAPWIMLGVVQEFDPGYELVTRRQLHLDEDLYVRDHSLGGCDVSRVDPKQHGSPVLPMTFSLEILAEAGVTLLPQLKVIAIENVRLHRWIAFEEGMPTILEIRARVLPAGENESQWTVSATISDCGNSVENPLPPRLVVEANVLLAAEYPGPPASQIEFVNERPSSITLPMLYRSLFHGPMFRGVLSTDRYADRAVEGTVRVSERGDWFRSTREPALVYDPVFLDAAMHVLVGWHLEQPDQSGRVLLPFKLDRIEFFAPTPPPYTQVKALAYLEMETARNVRHSLEVFGPDGRMLHRMKGAWYWRFYLPIGDKINFNSPKDEYFLSVLWPEALPPGADACCMFLEPPLDLNQTLMLASLARVTSTPEEQREYFQLPDNNAERIAWLFQRLGVKDAARQYWFDKHGERLMPADMVLRIEGEGRATLSPRDPDRSDALPLVRMASQGAKVAALAAFHGRPGIALAVVPAADQTLAMDGLDAEEQRLLHRFGAGVECLTRFLCARHAIVQALAPELPGAEVGVAVRGGDLATGRLLLAVGPALAEAFPEYRMDLLCVQTARRDNLVVATTLCQRGEQ
jgi:malonyl CoA-acyl carrier protein transacylase